MSKTFYESIFQELLITSCQHPSFSQRGSIFFVGRFPFDPLLHSSVLINVNKMFSLGKTSAVRFTFYSNFVTKGAPALHGEMNKKQLICFPLNNGVHAVKTIYYFVTNKFRKKRESQPDESINLSQQKNFQFERENPSVNFSLCKGYRILPQKCSMMYGTMER